MIVSRKMAEAAAAELGLALHETLDDQTVALAYRAMARVVHPDVGGSAEAFAAVDRAKHVLLGWLERSTGPAPAAAGGKCATCAGKGHVTVQRGFKSHWIMCGACKGSGDAGYDHDQKAGGDL